MLPLHERDLPENAPCHGIWLPRLQWERQEELDEFAGPYTGRYNVLGRRAWWQNRNIDDMLREHGYVPPGAPSNSRRSFGADPGEVEELMVGWAFCGTLRAVPATGATTFRDRHPGRREIVFGAAPARRRRSRRRSGSKSHRSYSRRRGCGG
jgi:hypothetical protein